MYYLQCTLVRSAAGDGRNFVNTVFDSFLEKKLSSTFCKTTISFIVMFNHKRFNEIRSKPSISFFIEFNER